MANRISVTGNLGGDPELRFTQSGKAVANLRVADTHRIKRGDQWEDGSTLWLAVVVWGEAAENLCETLHKGDRVMVSGRLESQDWTDSEGKPRTSVVVVADTVGKVARRAHATVRAVPETA